MTAKQIIVTLVVIAAIYEGYRFYEYKKAGLPFTGLVG